MLRRLSPWKDSMSPTRPMIVRTTPRLTNAWPPTLSTRSVTWAICSSVASGAITTTMALTLAVCPRGGRPFRHAGRPVRRSHGDVRDLRLDPPAGNQLDDEHRGEDQRATEEDPAG